MNDQLTKKCAKCGGEFPATTEYFYKNSRGVSGLHSYCKSCTKQSSREVYWQNPERERERTRKRYSAEGMRNWRRANPDKVRINAQRWRENNPDKVRVQARVQARNWRKNNPELARERGRARYREETRRVESQINHEHAIKQRNANWKKNNPDKVRIFKQRRRARKLSLPDTLTAEQWQYALVYFNHACAVCGSTDRINADHWIPLSHPDCPGTTAQNIIPLCASCNSSKQDALPDVWLKRRIPDNFATVLERIGQYFDSLGDRT